MDYAQQTEKFLEFLTRKQDKRWCGIIPFQTSANGELEKVMLNGAQEAD